MAHMYVYAKPLSRVQLFAAPWTVGHQAPLPMKFSRQEYWVECHLLLQVTSPTQGSNQCLLHLLPWHVDSLPLHHLGYPSSKQKKKKKTDVSTFEGQPLGLLWWLSSQDCAFHPWGPGSIPGQGTKIPHATQWNQRKQRGNSWWSLYLVLTQKDTRHRSFVAIQISYFYKKINFIFP